MQLQRIGYIDSLRGLLIIIMVYNHIASYSWGHCSMAYNDIVESFFMPAFFFLSGFLSYKKGQNWNSLKVVLLLRKKFRVLIIPFIFFMMLYLITFDLFDVNSLGSDKKGYWFTYVLFEYYVIYSISERLFNMNNTNAGEIRILSIVLIISISSFYYCTVYNSHAEDLGIWKSVFGLLSFIKFRHFIFFWIGAFLRRHFESFIKYINNQYMMATIILIYIVFLTHPCFDFTWELEYIEYVLKGATASIILFTLFYRKQFLFSNNTNIGNLLQLIGQRTLDIYLIHYFVIPYNLHIIGDWLNRYYNPSFDMLITFCLAIWVTLLSIALGSIIRLSPFLANYILGGVKAK